LTNDLSATSGAEEVEETDETFQQIFVPFCFLGLNPGPELSENFS